MILSVISVAHAMAPTSGGGGAGGGLSAFFPLILMFVIFYFLLIRPQQTKAKKHRKMLDELKRDDTVLTTGGIHGKITGLTDTIVTVEIAQNVRVKVARGNIAGLAQTQIKTEDKAK